MRKQLAKGLPMSAVTPADVRTVSVWDWPTRLFHWSLAVLIVVCWFTGEEEGAAEIHRIAGESIAGLLVFRVIWGFVGGEHARFADFAAGPRAVIAHVRNVMGAAPKRHLGHNPLGGIAVFLLLGVTATVVVSGLFSGDDGIAGPFAGLWGLELSDLHEVTFRVLQGLVALHLLGVAVESWKTRDALVPAMVTGTKKRRAEESGHDARKAGAVALLVSIAIAMTTTAALVAAPPGVAAASDRTGDQSEEEGDWD